MDPHAGLSRRERQIMDALWARGEATAAQVRDGMADPPANASVRTFLRILEHKGCVRHRRDGKEFVYTPTRERAAAGRSALQRVLATFFEGSVEKALTAYLADGRRAQSLDAEELRRLSEMIEQTRRGKEKSR